MLLSVFLELYVEIAETAASVPASPIYCTKLSTIEQLASGGEQANLHASGLICPHQGNRRQQVNRQQHAWVA